MSKLVLMPKLGFDMAEGTLVRKLKQPGDAVATDEVLAEIETDKATVEVQAPAAGIVKGWLVEEGQVLPVGALMAVIAAAEEAVDLEALRSGAQALPAPAEALPAPSSSAAPPAAAPAAPMAAQPPPELATARGPVFVSPLARRLAADARIDLNQIQGSGPQGRIVKKDVEAFVSASATAMPAAAAPAPTVGDEAAPLTRLRQAIARRMVESNQTVPPFYITARIDMEAALLLRHQLNDVLPYEGKLSVNDLIIKAAAITLRRFPNLNATFAGDKIIRHGHINIGIAVGGQNGLLTVVLRDVDQKSLAEIAREARTLIGRARTGKVQAADIEGSTFSVSNLGMYEVAHFIAIITPPEAAVLAAGQVQAVPVAKDGAVVVGQVMEATLSADHRVTDGVEAAQFVQAFRQNLETPARLVV
jgi:pyruvate dehydrogenase E2 component (dihydrolipoamide acetyltransferase)